MYFLTNDYCLELSYMYFLTNDYCLELSYNVYFNQ
jgi:hypothetical protein